MEYLRFQTVWLCLLIVYVHGQVQPSLKQIVSQTCLGCICEASSGCNTTLKCNGEVCGPFRITWPYWVDGGKPTLNNQPSDSSNAYASCVTDVYCAASTIQGYMTKYEQDCNGDGIVDCEDYGRIHRYGGYGCRTTLDPLFETSFKLCLTTFG